MAMESSCKETFCKNVNKLHSIIYPMSSTNVYRLSKKSYLKQFMSQSYTRSNECLTLCGDVCPEASQKVCEVTDISRRYDGCRSYSVIRRLRTSLFPSVYALELPTPAHRMDHNKKRMIQKKAITEVDVQEYLAKETGKDRLRVMYSKNILNQYSDEVKLINSILTKSLTITFLGMSFFGGYHAQEEYLRATQAVAFKSKFSAMRQYLDSVVLGGIKVGASWAITVALFAAVVLYSSQTIATYRNKSSPLEYTIGVGIAGSLTKFNLGLKGMFGGAVFGSIMGFVTGLMLVATFSSLNESQDVRHSRWVQTQLEYRRDVDMLSLTGTTGDPA